MTVRLRVTGLAAALLVAFAETAAHAQAPDCTLPGADALAARPHLRYVLVGEMHGTVETPRVFRDLVCSLSAAKRKIVVGLERPVDEQDEIDAILAGDGGEAAVNMLLLHRGWNIFDGRSSQAMLALVNDLRTLKRAGVIESVIAFDAVQYGDSGAQREERMGHLLAYAGQQHPDSLYVILTGNLHASRKPVARFGGYPWMAMFLPAAETVSLLVTDNGGETWTQQSDGCGPHPLKTSNGDRRGVAIGGAAAVERGYDGVLATGERSTASRPALADAPPPPVCYRDIDGRVHPELVPEHVVWEHFFWAMVAVGFDDPSATEPSATMIEALSRYNLFIPPAAVETTLHIAKAAAARVDELRRPLDEEGQGKVHLDWTPAQREARLREIQQVWLSARDQLRKALTAADMAAVQRYVTTKIVPSIRLSLNTRAPL